MAGCELVADARGKGVAVSNAGRVGVTDADTFGPGVVDAIEPGGVTVGAGLCVAAGTAGDPSVVADDGCVVATPLQPPTTRASMTDSKLPAIFGRSSANVGV